VSALPVKWERSDDGELVGHTTMAAFRAMRHTAAPSTPDDVPITADGRRLDTAEKVLAYLAGNVRSAV
jgi:hypothetical protein